MVTKKEFINAVRAEITHTTPKGEEVPLSYSDGNAIIDIVFDKLYDIIVSGKDIKIGKIGTFKVVNVGDRTAVNPSTREKFVIPAHKALKFKPTEQLKEAIW